MVDIIGNEPGFLAVCTYFSTLIIALPDLLTGLQASLPQAMWVMLSYMVAQTVMVLMAGSLADRFGRKRIYIAGTFISGFAQQAPRADTSQCAAAYAIIRE
ncbi:MFS transporter [Paenibacillus lignilyticus]|uniref:MFS transporter n=1 Tax=Paenibacillus lignilyticus TaxID=1172615 RepID=A0ABS5CES6_9BACL|nr:MFS transporter [Paenibacillus lignilyticus]MBP3963928.1 MFS transporter [Paenibacillus lignilyticus]